MTKEEFERAVTAGVLVWENRLNMGLTSTAEEHIRAILLVALDSLAESDLEYCPYDCDHCHNEDCPCDRLGCAGYVKPHLKLV